jgi:hypothetical protein
MRHDAQFLAAIAGSRQFPSRVPQVDVSPSEHWIRSLVKRISPFGPAPPPPGEVFRRRFLPFAFREPLARTIAIVDNPTDGPHISFTGKAHIEQNEGPKSPQEGNITIAKGLYYSDLQENTFCCLGQWPQPPRVLRVVALAAGDVSVSAAF